MLCCFVDKHFPQDRFHPGCSKSFVYSAGRVPSPPVGTRVGSGSVKPEKNRSIQVDLGPDPVLTHPEGVAEDE